MVTLPQQEEKIPDVGVIVGRFQVPSLHDGHREVLKFVAERHAKVILVLGTTGHGQSTRMNPLDYESRVQMISEEFPNFVFQYIEDQADDKYWSRWLDRLINATTSASQSVLLYGSRDSFIPHYEGKYPTQELETENPTSATEVRNEIKRNGAVNSQAFREGRVSGAFDRFPVNYVTVDIAIFNEAGDEILLGQKEFEHDWRLPGGFSESSSPSLEVDARREAMEETHLEVTTPIYVGSFRINDWRYRNEVDKILTTLFIAKPIFGRAEGGDDLPLVRWFKVSDLLAADLDIVAENHRALVEAAIKKKGVLAND